MALDKTAFLKFSAYSIKDAITQSLAQNSKFTDEIYPGSNLQVLIDIISYMYQILVEQLNSAAAESMFADTTVFENITRLVRLLDYNVKGCSPASFTTYITTTSFDGDDGETEKTYVLQPYSYIQTAKSDVRGKPICFSCREGCMLTQNASVPISLYNGIWKLYPKVFVASGIENETFDLENLFSDSEAGKFVAHNFIDVYVRNPSSGKSRDVLVKWSFDSTGIFLGHSTTADHHETNFTTIYGKGEKIYTLTLVGDKSYQLRFGDGVVGARLPAGSEVYVVYLDTNGLDGNIDLSELNVNTIKFKKSMINSQVYDNIKFTDSESEICDIADYNNIYQLQLNSLMINSAALEETVDDIRSNAPNQFKVGNRLITQADYEYYIKNSNYVSEATDLNIVDVKCMNNYQYVTSFYKWLYMMGLTHHANGKTYFQNDFLLRSGYKQIDAADGNNTYIWLKSDSITNANSLDDYDVDYVQTQLNNILNPMKTMTTEIQVVRPVIVSFDICADSDPVDVKRRYLDGTKEWFDPTGESYIEITINDNVIYSSTSIKEQIYKIITDAFNVNKCQLGQNINFADILNQIYAINGIQRVRTIFKPTDESIVRSYDGIAFASWSDVLVPMNTVDPTNGYDDLEISNSARHLEDFQFPRFVGSYKLTEKIKVIRKSLTSINTIKQ